MLVFCEECGARNDISERVFNDEKNPARCDSCHDILNKAIARKLKMAQQSALAVNKAKAKAKEQEAQAAQAAQELEAVVNEKGIIEPVACERMETAVIEIIDPKDLDRNVTLGEF
ncbi:MAG: hypothetical protein QMD09_10655 [Desulfatibacillaceae bacterium]|nr:hypothetical protein [Desulfatibacillaceae bacterium]